MVCCNFLQLPRTDWQIGRVMSAERDTHAELRHMQRQDKWRAYDVWRTVTDLWQTVTGLS